jgi:hypothetical protein
LAGIAGKFLRTPGFSKPHRDFFTPLHVRAMSGLKQKGARASRPHSFEVLWASF